MIVVNRLGKKEAFSEERLLATLLEMSKSLNIDVSYVLKKVVSGIRSEITVEELMEFTTEVLASQQTIDPDYGAAASNLWYSWLYSCTPSLFSEAVSRLYGNKSSSGEHKPLVTKEFHEFVEKNKARLDEAIDYNKDYRLSYFGLKTLEKTFLLRINDKIVERPQHLIMRVSVALYMDIDKTLNCYRHMADLQFTHATPTLFFSGTPCNQLSSCYLVDIKEDSIEGIYETIKDCAILNSVCGGIGLSISKIRGMGSVIKSSNGKSSGVIPMIKVFDSALSFTNSMSQRKTNIAIYIEPWHVDVLEFLELKKNTGAEERRARNLFYGLWIPDLFMRRVEAGESWSLFCPTAAPRLLETYGEEFDRAYEEYEARNLASRVVPAQEVWRAIVDSQIETGIPYMLYKDACNRKSNQKNTGMIHSSNLCAEIVQNTSKDEIAVCNIASISLPAFVSNNSYDFDKLHGISKLITENLNRIVDNTSYPLDTARKSSTRHRAIGIGVQGLADVFATLKIPYESQAALDLNRKIFETIYHGALEMSCELAEVHGPYDSYEGSPASQGLLQYDMWDEKPAFLKWDWDLLKEKIRRYGLRNSLLVAPMPTATTSQILGNNECFEPFTNNIYTRRVVAGEFQIINKYLVEDLRLLGLWNEEMKTEIVRRDGSIQDIECIPDSIKQLYKTVWEMSQRSLIDMARSRSPFIDQSSSLNLFIAKPSQSKLTSMHFYAWKKGLKTGMYYLRTLPAAQAIKFTIVPPKKESEEKRNR